MKKKGLILAALALLIAVLAVGCTTKDPKAAATPAADAQPAFTLEELSTYDGKDGRQAYVAVDGVVYNVTELPQWTEGAHAGNVAGQDLTDVILESPHGKTVLEGLPVVGTLKTGS